MTEDLILNEESVASKEQAVSEATKTAKKAYITPQMEIEYFDVEDVIATSGGGGGGTGTSGHYEGPPPDGTGGNAGNPDDFGDLDW